MGGSDTRRIPRILFFNINGNGTGHLSRCLAYARRLEGRARPIFFSLASAIEVIHSMGFEADYFVSIFWSRAHINAWNRDLAVRFGLMLEETQPDVVVFDGTWPFQGFMDACDSYGVPARVWSNRGLHKKDFPPVPVQETDFDLVICPGEIGSQHGVDKEDAPGRKVNVPPVTLLRSEELADRREARAALGLNQEERYALLSLGPGNIKDIRGIAPGLIRQFGNQGYRVCWARAPISVSDPPLPPEVQPVSAYPLVRYMRAFDTFVGAAGYNTCCEVIQSGVPTILVPNEQVADDQEKRARMLEDYCRVVVSPCESPEQQALAVSELLAAAEPLESSENLPALDGAEHGADEILALAKRSMDG
jgi:UDP:flavonoid glycosyltransferase YjiC (YdhE family)